MRRFSQQPRGMCGKVKVRVGTAPAHGVKMRDPETGEEKFIKVPAKGIYREVGRPDAIPEGYRGRHK